MCIGWFFCFLFFFRSFYVLGSGFLSLGVIEFVGGCRSFRLFRMRWFVISELFVTDIF